jgi:acetyl esterase
MKPPLPPPQPCAQASAYLEGLPPQRPMWQRTIGELRRDARDLAMAHGGQPAPVASVTEINANGVPARLYQPAGGEQSVLVWLHGGAWMVGDTDCHDNLVRALAVSAGCAALSVNYRRAPECRYPAATNDAWSATQWAAEHFLSVAVGGDSSGGNLAAAAALRARDSGIRLACQLLVYPVLDSDTDAPYRREFIARYEQFRGRAGFGRASQQNLRYIWGQYVPDPLQRRSGDASPLHAARLSRVAPAVIVTAEHDILRAEAERYARRLTEAGVGASVREYKGQIHGFYGLLGVMPDARDAVQYSAEALRQAFRDGACFFEQLPDRPSPVTRS